MLKSFLSLTLFFSLVYDISSSAQELYSYTLVDSIAFEFNFGKTEVINIDTVNVRLKNIEIDENSKISINGYTDTVGTIVYNTVLAQKRIDKVMRLMDHYERLGASISVNNCNENRDGKNAIPDSLFRRVDVLIYHYQLNVPLNKNYPFYILFGGSSAFLLPEAKVIVEEIAEVLLRDKTLNIELQGHISGNDPDYELSLNRAISVKDFMVELGVEDYRITCVGMSNEHKLYPEYNEKNRKLNRRVEIILTKRE